MIIFNASMARAGSSLLQHVMGQNPNFYVTPTSPLCDLIDSTIAGWCNKGITLHPNIYDKIEKSLYSYCREGINGYISNITNKPYFLDKNRDWLSNYWFLKKLYPSPKIICLVRDIRSVISSFEKQYRKRPPKHFEIRRNNRNVLVRYEKFYLQAPLIKPYLEDLFEVIQTGSFKNILFIRFEDLCSNPKRSMQQIYNYLELPYYEHNFTNIESLFDEVDDHLLIAEHNNIKSKIELPKTDYNDILGNNISQDIYSRFPWFYKFFKYNE